MKKKSLITVLMILFTLVYTEVFANSNISFQSSDNQFIHPEFEAERHTPFSIFANCGHQTMSLSFISNVQRRAVL